MKGERFRRIVDPGEILSRDRLTALGGDLASRCGQCEEGFRQELANLRPTARQPAGRDQGIIAVARSDAGAVGFPIDQSRHIDGVFPLRLRVVPQGSTRTRAAAAGSSSAFLAATARSGMDFPRLSRRAQPHSRRRPSHHRHHQAQSDPRDWRGWPADVFCGGRHALSSRRREGAGIEKSRRKI